MTNTFFKGSCLCGEIAYEIEGPFKIFQYCHCSRCRKTSGSAHSSNLFVPPERFKWTKGEELLGRFEQPDAKYFASTFCKQCGSSLPWAVQGGKNIVVTAGTLDDDPGIKPLWNVFWQSKAEWFCCTSELPAHDRFPK
tara:strand:- start:8041 stop:8454 length:414 start_codon:yes stop_codon:yes gene_type:complete